MKVQNPTNRRSLASTGSAVCGRTGEHRIKRDASRVFFSGRRSLRAPPKLGIQRIRSKATDGFYNAVTPFPKEHRLLDPKLREASPGINVSQRGGQETTSRKNTTTIPSRDQEGRNATMRCHRTSEPAYNRPGEHKISELGNC